MSNQLDGIEALKLWKEGEQAYDRGEYEASVSCYHQAMAIAQGLPRDEFDGPVFLASCNMGLSGSLGALGRHEEALACADEALRFYERYGFMYPVEYGRWISAWMNRGASLGNLGMLDEALVAMQRAKTILEEASELTPVGSELLSQCEQTIQAIKEAQKAKSTSKKKWWRIWR